MKPYQAIDYSNAIFYNQPQLKVIECTIISIVQRALSHVDYAQIYLAINGTIYDFIIMYADTEGVINAVI